MERHDPSGKTSLRVRRQHTMLRDLVLEGLREAILRGEFKPGERLIERELCELFGVSRTSVREALRRLESEGLVHSVPNKGPVIATLSAGEAAHVNELREVLFAQAARSFARRGSDRQMAMLKQALAKLERAAQAGDARKTADEAVRLYAGLVEGGGNPVLGDLVRSLNARIMFLRASSAPPPGRARESLDELRRLVAAIAARDAQAAHDAAAEHVQRGGGAALMALKPPA